MSMIHKITWMGSKQRSYLSEAKSLGEYGFDILQQESQLEVRAINSLFHVSVAAKDTATDEDFINLIKGHYPLEKYNLQRDGKNGLKAYVPYAIIYWRP